MKQKSTDELLKDFTANGGEIKTLPAVKVQSSGFSRYRMNDLNPGFGQRYQGVMKLKRELKKRKRLQKKTESTGESPT